MEHAYCAGQLQVHGHILDRRKSGLFKGQSASVALTTDSQLCRYSKRRLPRILDMVIEDSYYISVSWRMN